MRFAHLFQHNASWFNQWLAHEVARSIAVNRVAYDVHNRNFKIPLPHDQFNKRNLAESLAVVLRDTSYTAIISTDEGLGNRSSAIYFIGEGRRRGIVEVAAADLWNWPMHYLLPIPHAVTYSYSYSEIPANAHVVFKNAARVSCEGLTFDPNRGVLGLSREVFRWGPQLHHPYARLSPYTLQNLLPRLDALQRDLPPPTITVRENLYMPCGTPWSKIDPVLDDRAAEGMNDVFPVHIATRPRVDQLTIIGPLGQDLTPASGRLLPPESTGIYDCGRPLNFHPVRHPVEFRGFSDAVMTLASAFEDEDEDEDEEAFLMVTARTEESFSVTRRREDCREWVCARCNTTAYTQGEGVTPMRWRIHRDPHLCVECSGNSHLYNYTWQPDLLGGKGRDVVTTNVARELLWIVSPELEYSNTWRESEPVMTPKMFYRKTLWAPCHDSSCGFEMKGPALIADSNGVVLNGLPPEVIKVINRSDPSDAGGHLNISAWRGQRPDSSLLPILAGAHVLLPLFAFCWPDRATNAQCRIPHVNWSLSKKKQAACLKVGTCVEIRIIPAYSSSAMLFSTIKLVVQFLARFKALVDTSDMNNLSHWHDSDLVGFMMDYAVRYGDKTQASIQAIADRGRSNRANQFDYFLGYTSDLRRRMEIRANRCLEAQQ